MFHPRSGTEGYEIRSAVMEEAPTFDALEDAQEDAQRRSEADPQARFHVIDMYTGRTEVMFHQGEGWWMERYCGAWVNGAGDHLGMARCYCGWSASGGDGRRELREMGETIEPEEV